MYKGPAVWVLSAKKRFLKEGKQILRLKLWTLKNYHFPPSACIESLLYHPLDFEGIKINQSLSTMKWVACRRLTSKLTDTQTERMGIPKGLGSMGQGPLSLRGEWENTGIHFQRLTELLLKEQNWISIGWKTRMKERRENGGGRDGTKDDGIEGILFIYKDSSSFTRSWGSEITWPASASTKWWVKKRKKTFN